MSDEISGWIILIGFSLFLGICGLIQTRLRKRQMKLEKVKVKKPGKKDYLAFEKLESIRPDDENWLYLRFKLRRRSMRLERWNDDALYICLNGEIIGEIVLNREGFSGSIGEHFFYFLDNTLYKNHKKIGYTAKHTIEVNLNKYTFSAMSEHSLLGKIRYVQLFKQEESDNNGELIAKSLNLSEKIIGKHYSIVYYLKKSAPLESIITLTYMLHHEMFYPSSD